MHTQSRDHPVPTGAPTRNHIECFFLYTTQSYLRHQIQEAHQGEYARVRGPAHDMGREPEQQRADLPMEEGYKFPKNFKTIIKIARTLKSNRDAEAIADTAGASE